MSARPAPAAEPVAPGNPVRLPDDWSTRPVMIGKVMLIPTDGRCAVELAHSLGHAVAVSDLCFDANVRRVALALSPMPAEARRDVVASLQAAGKQVTIIPDWPGLVVMRTLAMLVNEAHEAMLQGVAEGDAIDRAMRYGVNYPFGPVEWGRLVGLERMVSVLDAIFANTGDPRYRVAMNLRHAARSLPKAAPETRMGSEGD